MTFMSEMNVFENEEGQEGFGLQRNITSTTREISTVPTDPQQKTVECFSHFGRVEAVTFQQKCVEGFLLNRSVCKAGSSSVAGQVIY